ncbi:MAG: TauD/TfdA family dioxygenase [Proteobacteria bacterium]|nr:TauD/TfdA family dioxygenase [Pseudomonadota bacterium]MDA1325169.1 TauD/TfdA family dioxygenase [Pseudomonadota bacterium]
MGKAGSKSSLENASPVLVKKLGANIGAEISCVDLTRKLDPADVKMIKDAFVEHEVLVFRDQALTQDQYIDFTGQLGELTIHPFATALPDHPELIVLWDNISTQHYAPRDFLPYRRRMERLTIKGSRPYGIAGKKKYQTVKMNVRGTAPESRTDQHRKGLTRPANAILTAS